MSITGTIPMDLQALWRLDTILFNNLAGTATISLSVYASVAALNNSFPLTSQIFTLDMQDNPDLLEAITNAAESAIVEHLQNGVSLFEGVAPSEPPPPPPPITEE